MSYFDCNM